MSKKELNLLLPAAVIILAVASYLLCSNLLMPKISENSAKITAFDHDISAANQKLDSLSAADKSMSTLTDLVNNLLVAVPEGINSPDLITEIEAIANQNKVSLPSLSPPASIGSSGSASADGLVTNLSVTGSFQNINNFINSLETSIRFSKINNLTLAASDSGLTAAINFSVYSRLVAGNSTEVPK